MPKCLTYSLASVFSVFLLFVIGLQYFEMSILLNRWPFGALSVIFESHNVTATNITNRTQHFQITDKEVIKYNVSTTGPPPVNTTEEPPLYVAYRHEPWGRLGNQMFQFASALGIARSQGRKLIHPSEFWLFNSFNLSYKFPDMDTSGWTTMYEQHFGFFDTRFMNLPATNIIIEGIRRIPATHEEAPLLRKHTARLLTAQRFHLVPGNLEPGVLSKMTASFGTVKLSPVSNNISSLVVQNKQLYIGLYSKRGRLGNQMFQYASLLGIARAQGRKLVRPRIFLLDQVFDVKYEFAEMNTSEWPKIRQINFGYYDTRLMKLPPYNIQIQGYLQSFKYFHSIRGDIRHEFTFLKDIDVKADEMLDTFCANRSQLTLVGVHVRRGDFVQSETYNTFVPQKSFFDNAFTWMRDTLHGKVLFLAVSDDPNWCTLTLQGDDDLVVLPKAPAGVHLAVLSKCNHVIISGGTFGWWGAWLAGGHVIYFDKYMDKGTELGAGFFKEDFYLPGWVGLDN